ncbi:MAG: hypothetical protein K5675_10265 [Lachnospiraceae bacterium]|nr:hypothetical protein [Lachnospiraceae bacterium]
MKEVLLVLSALPFLGMGFYVMKKLDGFIFDREKPLEDESKLKEPFEVILSSDLSLAEIDHEIDKYRKKHSDFAIILKGGKVADNELERK